MPTQSDRLTTLRDSTPKGELPYISKSRLSKYVTCPEQFRYSYVQGLKEPGTIYTRRGTAIHEVFEDYYHAVGAYVDETGEFPEDLVDFLPDWERWADYTVPYITNFINFEYARIEATKASGQGPKMWLPVGIEAESWMDDPLPDRDGPQPPWMGYADAIYRDYTVPGVGRDGGVVIVDFKTGKTPAKKYRNEGIYLEGEYYAILFEQEWDVTAVAGYYPKNDDLIVSPLKESRREFIFETINEMLDMMAGDAPHWETDEQPLCKWGTGKDEQCSYYDICSSTWGEPGKHEDRFRDLMGQNLPQGQIADEMGTTVNAVNYWKYKLNL